MPLAETRRREGSLACWAAQSLAAGSRCLANGQCRPLAHPCISSSDLRTELPSTKHSLPHLCFFSSWGAHLVEFSVGAWSTATPTPKGNRFFSVESHSGFQKACHTNMEQCALFLVFVYFWVTRTSRILMRRDVG